MRKTIKNSIKMNVPLLLLGRSGWGKSAIVAEIANEMNLPIVDLRLSGILPEDLTGVIYPSENKQNYTYLAPDWVHKYRDKEFILFLDEINQATTSTLHAAYKVVLDREFCGIKMPQMRIIAAGNEMDENPFLTELPEPLMKRFYIREWECDVNAAVNHLNNKYNVNLINIYTNPRQTEMALKMWQLRDDDAVTALGGARMLADLKENEQTSGEGLLGEIELVKSFMRNGIDVPEKYQHIKDEFL